MAVLCTHQDGPVSKMSCCTRGYAWLAKVLRLSMWSDHSNTPQVGVEPCGVTHSEHYAQLSTGVDRRQTPRGGGETWCTINVAVFASAPGCSAWSC